MAGSRLYKTGDLARYLPNGNIEFLGRIDHQVKLRGFRVELDEIESVLIGHPAVREAVVTARETGPGGKWLVAYIVQGSGVKGQGSGNGSPQFTVGTQQSNDNWIRSESSSIVHRLSSANDQSDRSSFRVPSGRRNSSLASELRSFLREHLPDYMVPAAFVLLPALPLNPNGKVDRKALPEPERAEADGAFVAPRTPNEEIMAGIWSAVLRLERISIADHFFELGGHSLLATQLVSRVRDVFRVELPLRTLFETPTVSGLTERVEQIRRAAVDLSMPPLQPVPRDSDIPLSFAQQRLWFFDQWAPGTIAYTLPVAVRLTGQLDVAVLRRSLGQIVRRHESLRTTFAICNGYPVQVIKPSLALDLPLLDLQALPARARAAASQRICEAESLRPFDLARGPLLRAGLVRVDAAEHIFLLTLHHIVADGWSIAVFIEEFRALYDALCAGRSAALPELPIQYADFAVWQRAWLQGDVLERQLAYWRRHLDGAEVLELPTDRPRPAVQSLRGAHVAQMLPPSLSQALHTLSRGASVTLFMTLLAAFLVLLQRYSDQDDIVVGAPIANRTLSEIERLIGFFVNTLALRADLAGNPPFQELLRHIRQVCLAAYAHQDLPFEKLVEGLELERDVSRNPLFQVMFMLQNVPMSVFELTNLVLRPLDIDRAIATFDITLAMDDTTEGLLAVWEYNTDLFDAATIARMVGHFQTLLHEVVSAPERPIADLPLLAAVERSQILVGWNVTRAISPAAHCFHQLYAAQAARIPDSIAVAYGDMQITYQELERRANQLAHLLRRSGVTSDVCVGVCVERSLELIVGLLAILKAGGAYVPLDPAYPEERLAFMLEDSQAKVLLTQRAFDDGRWTIDDGAQSETEIVYGLSSIVYLDADWPRIARQPAHAPDVPVLPEHLAYVIYTSGSTGTPKGVMVQHDTLVSFCTMAGEEYRLAPGDRGLQFTSISWDTSVEEIFPCLAYGAALVLRPPSMLDSMASFVGACQALGISVLNLPTAVWHVLAASFEQEQPIFPDTIRLVIIGGERVQPEQLAKWWRYVSPSVQLLNTYGLAEATVEVTRCDLSCDPEEWGAGREIPIGRPFPGVQIYVLDRRFEPALIGVAGELYVGGTNLSRGYLNRPDLTAERFVPNPFGTVNDEDRTMKSPDSSFIVHRSSFGERLYKTGDVARYRPDGQLEFVGRSDDQVKIRGYRVELGEIETVLNQHPAVREVVVLAREEIRPSGGYSDKRLVAYVVPSNDQRPTTNDQRSSLEDRRLKIEDSNGDASGSRSSILYPLSSELRSFLQERLPDYMLPSAVVLLDALPLTPNGKVDSRALPAPDWATAEKGVEFVAPRTPIEQQVALIWAQVLGVAQVGVHDNFFALGGHSLLATQALARIRDVFEIELPLSNLFETPTVAGLAASIETILWAVQGEETALPPDGLEEEGEL